LEKGIDEFITWIEMKQTQYHFVSDKSNWVFLSDTVGADASHLNAALNQYGYLPLTRLLDPSIDRFQDVVCTKSWRTLAMAHGNSNSDFKKHPAWPTNKQAHDAESDAIYIGQCFFFYHDWAIQQFLQYQALQKALK